MWGVWSLPNCSVDLQINGPMFPAPFIYLGCLTSLANSGYMTEANGKIRLVGLSWRT